MDERRVPPLPVREEALAREESCRERELRSLERSECLIEILDAGEMDTHFRIDDRIDDELELFSGLLERSGRPFEPFRIACDDVEEHIRVDECSAHDPPRVRAMISSVLSAAGPPTPRSCSTIAAPRDRCRGLALRRRASLSTTTKSTSVCGKRPSASRTSRGIVTCPFTVIRMLE